MIMKQIIVGVLVVLIPAAISIVVSNRMSSESNTDFRIRTERKIEVMQIELERVKTQQCFLLRRYNEKPS